MKTKKKNARRQGMSDDTEHVPHDTEPSRRLGLRGKVITDLVLDNDVTVAPEQQIPGLERVAEFRLRQELLACGAPHSSARQRHLTSRAVSWESTTAFRFATGTAQAMRRCMHRFHGIRGRSLTQRANLRQVGRRW